MTVAAESGWIKLAGAYRTLPRLAGNVATDWLVIGGGFTGLAAARELAERCAGQRIVLIDAKKLAQGAAARNSGFNVGYDLPEFPLARAAAQRAEYMARTRIDIAGALENERLIASLGIDCEYQPTGFHYAAHDPRRFADAGELAAFLRDAGARAEVIDGEAAAARFGTPFYRRALLVAGGGNGALQPAKFAKGLADTMPAAVEMFEDTPALGLAPLQGGGAKVPVPGGEIRARRVIVGLNGHLPRFGYKRFHMLPLTLTASLTRPLTAAEDEAIGRPEPWAVLSVVASATTARLTPDRRILIRNTVEYHPRGVDAAGIASRRQTHLKSLQRRFPWMTEADIAFSWAGTMAGSRGHRFIFEQASPGVYLAACCNGNGVSRLSMLGRLAVHYATGDQNELLSTALSLAPPGLIPPDPLLRLGVALRFALERRQAAAEL